MINLLPGGQFSGLSNITIANIVTALITLVLVLAALIFFFILIWGGIQYITSGGDKGQTEAARGKITAAFIGLLIVFAAWAAISLVQSFFGVNITTLNIPNAQGP
ncbi:hypothetical protein A2865_00455 [Candidatus Woesebacteria bacterium RIFCSPHIGHO2_01_FULL_39_17]|uniref:Integral membrane protein n=2 Tax=Candidatus Woeseibacteriota TaxID=1752722 RepID=A0A0G0QS57_9BACT|nr:MAG: hypothetical protein US72_C0014G0009 [Microgenomates group bacterium GW2011_GWC1_38_12]KKR13195.1 MAG: hypothetical protein UT40_C0022G0008 [Candidatus Woesebacteria bacterium GW2011_GWA1_39_21b]OGM24010.1 MAG: hypothetical protein A2865_00455 [Candidatus Woesebacteria bacterium RIFCSPHIGHO2_01_FULL_39_17]OGM65255.1 MAG: hypothetical protein A3A52_01890 [Candidatus Woesebacteria bacterium RIFCSPLOWO2_01_FULL_39_14]